MLHEESVYLVFLLNWATLVHITAQQHWLEWPFVDGDLSALSDCLSPHPALESETASFAHFHNLPGCCWHSDMSPFMGLTCSLDTELAKQRWERPLAA